MRCLYVDLDGTLLGAGRVAPPRRRRRSRTARRARDRGVRCGPAWRSCSTPAAGRSLLRATRGCSASRSYIFEAGAGARARRRAALADRDLRAAGTARRSTTRSRRPARPHCCSSTTPGRLEYHDPWHRDREVTPPVPRRRRRARGRRAAERARPREPAARRQRRGPSDHAPGLEPTAAARYHLVPAGASKASARRASTCAPAATRARTASRSATRARTWAPPPS